MTQKLVAKADHSIEITRTMEVVYGSCSISPDVDDPRGWSFDCGGTDIDWDSQKQVTKHVDSMGYLPVFLDQAGNQYTSDQIELIEIPS